MSSIVLAVEDDLSDAVARRLVEEVRPDLEVITSYIGGGFGSLKRRLPAFNNASRVIPHLVLTDLDNAECPPALISDWLSGERQRPLLLIRIAVRQVESWLMADRNAFAKFLGVATNRVHAYPEQLANAKKELIQLARTSPKRSLRRALTPVWNASQGPDHNDTLIQFVNSTWGLQRAAGNCESLRRTVNALSVVLR